METFTRWVYYFLESLGLDLSYMTNLNRLIVLVLIAVLAFLTAGKGLYGWCVRLPKRQR